MKKNALTSDIINKMAAIFYGFGVLLIWWFTSAMRNCFTIGSNKRYFTNIRIRPVKVASVNDTLKFKIFYTDENAVDVLVETITATLVSGRNGLMTSEIDDNILLSVLKIKQVKEAPPRKQSLTH